MEIPPSHTKEAIAARMKSALLEHPVTDRRGWTSRELTRAVVVESGVRQDEDNGRTWLAGTQPRVPAVAAALARVLAVRAGWLYFGEEPREAPAISESVADAFKSEDQVDAERAETAARSRKRRA